LISTLSSLTTMYTGLSDAPSTMIPSHPADLNSKAKLPPDELSPNMPVSGDLAHTENRAPPGIFVPLVGPPNIKNVLSGDSGAISGATRSSISFAPNPLPPMYLLRTSLSTTEVFTVPSVRLTSAILPTNPVIFTSLFAVLHSIAMPRLP